MVGKSPKKKRNYTQTGFDDFPSIEAFNLMDRDRQELTRKLLINFASDYYPQTDTWHKCSFCYKWFSEKWNRNRHQIKSCSAYKNAKAQAALHGEILKTDQEKEKEQQQLKR